MQYRLQIIPVPAFKDNYIWLIHNGKKAAAVDPGDAEPLQKTLKALGLDLEVILITHHHHDHIDGVDTLCRAFPDVRIFAPALEHYNFRHTPVSETDKLDCAEWLPAA